MQSCAARAMRGLPGAIPKMTTPLWVGASGVRAGAGGRGCGERAISCKDPAEMPSLAVPWDKGRAVYKRLLRAVKYYPSIKRDGIREDIRTEFREHKGIVDEKMLLRHRSQALSGLAGLEQYSKKNLSAGDQYWEVGPIKHQDPRNPNVETRR